MDDLTHCQICFEQYNQNERIPKMLTACQHSFCKLCIRGVYKPENNFIECPICRGKTYVRFDDIPTNRLIVQLMESNAIPRSNSSSFNNPTTTVNRNSTNSMTNYSTNNNMQQSYSTPPRANAPEFQNHSHQQWDESRYFREIFDDIDHNRDGKINFDELHLALARGAANSQFDRKTVEILLRKYDQNNDGEITFNEFFSLFTGINHEYNEFLDIDEDFSGTIDENELQNVLNKKSIYLSKPFFKYLTDSLKFRNNNNGITFDIYVRILALIQHLITLYRNIPQNRNKINQPGAIDWNLEAFLRDNFFSYF